MRKLLKQAQGHRSEFLIFYSSMFLEEAPRVIYYLVDVRLRILPRKNCDLGIWSEVCDLHRGRVWVRGYVVGSYQ